MRPSSRPANPAAVALLAATLALSGCATTEKAAPAADPTQEPGDTVVELVGLEFDPRTISVPVGTRVLWKWTDSVVHDIISTDFASAKPKGGGTHAVRFDRVGTFPYRCTLHIGMDGTVVVTP